MTPKRAYGIHKRTAAKRGIEFHFTLEEWVNWWIKHLGSDWQAKRGRCKGQYQMCRKGDVGPYAEGNVTCDIQEENMRQAHMNNHERGRGHGNCLPGEAHWCAKLTKMQAIEIYASKDDPKALAARYGVTKVQIRAIQLGKRWKSVTKTLG